MNSNLHSNTVDLAGKVNLHPYYLDTRSRINHLIDRYLCIDVLSERLSNIETQFTHPQPRPWEPINWKGISRDQIIGITPELFIQIVASAAEIEDPIREYARESWGYLQPINPQIARFMGGSFDPEGSTLEVGVWEKEERQHGPAFRKIYQLLTGEKLTPKPNSVAGYQAGGDPMQLAHNHTLSRISTEWGAASIYLWLAAHSTGDLQQVILQPLQDEINHLAKFWGFSKWAFADSYLHQFKGTTRNLMILLQHHQGERTNGKEMLQSSNRISQLRTVVELSFTMMRVMVRLRRWNSELSVSYLKHLFGPAPAKKSRSLAA